MSQIVFKGGFQQHKTKLQKAYEKLILEIETKKNQQSILEENLRLVMPKINSELMPLYNVRLAELKKLLFRIDDLAFTLKIHKRDFRYIEKYMFQEIGNLLAHQEDAELQKLQDKYQYNNNDEVLVLDDVMGEDYEEFIAPEFKTESKKSEIKIVEQDAKMIYIKLIKRFHPDLQQDAQKKIEFTEISKKLTKAYGNKDFLALLNLQIELLDENEAEEGILADDLLKRYNKVLKKQLREVDDKLNSIKFGNHGILKDFFEFDMQFSTKKFNEIKKQFQTDISQIQAMLESSYRFENEWFNQWLDQVKSY